MSSPALAKDLNGRLGVGLEESLGGATGLAIRYWPGEAFGIGIVLGATGESGAADSSSFDFSAEAGLRLVYNFARSLHANLGFGAGVAFGSRSKVENLEIQGETTSATQLNLEVPVIAEFFLSDNFSLSVATGFLFQFVGNERAGGVMDVKGQGATASKDVLAIGLGAGSIRATLGAVYYF